MGKVETSRVQKNSQFLKRPRRQKKKEKEEKSFPIECKFDASFSFTTLRERLYIGNFHEKMKLPHQQSLWFLIPLEKVLCGS